MNNGIISITRKIAEIASLKGLKHVVISPGSRSAPITLAFARHPNIKTYVIPDERSAGHIALGMSIYLNQVVGVVCTSGTAALNLYPAVAESFYQNIPLLIFTADRPPEWIDQADGQTIHQDMLYGHHVKRSFTMSSTHAHKDLEWHVERMVNEAINIASQPSRGPVHINVPIREPFYPGPDESYVYNNSTTKLIETIPENFTIDSETWKTFQNAWKDSKKIMIVAGQKRYDKEFNEVLSKFTMKFNAVLIGDAVANIHGSTGNRITHHDLILSGNPSGWRELYPDLLITLGKSVVSKKLKQFLRSNTPGQAWHISEVGYENDTFQSLTKSVRMDPLIFFKKALEKFEASEKTEQYAAEWNVRENKVETLVHNFFIKQQFSELESTYDILRMLPDNTNLHLANSMPVRLVNMIGHLKPGIEVHANRGASGIDGCLSTALGISMHSNCLNFILIGDMAFFYDRNGLWHNVIPGNMRIIILNNHGGGIFRMIDGPSELPELEEFFETVQLLHAKNTARDHGLDYFFCNDRKGLVTTFEKFCMDDGKSKILEIESNSQINKTIFDKYISEFH